jgi:hypothetical protein
VQAMPPKIQPCSAPVLVSRFPEHIIMSLINIPSLTNKRHQPSQEEWKELKPNIWQLYVKENKSLQRVVKLLGEKQGFVLTYVLQDP